MCGKSVEGANSGTGESLRFETDDERWGAVLNRDRAAEGHFILGVVTTGIYCRPGCPARRPRRENVRFFANAEEAEGAGFRPCKRCRPEGPSIEERRTAAVARACRLIESAEEVPDLATLADEAGMSRYHFHRVFKAATGLTPRAYASAHRARRVREALPKAEFDEAVRATRELMVDGAAGRGAFGVRRGEAAWIEQKLFWLSPGVGDGLAAVGEAAQAGQPEVVARVLDTGKPGALTGLGAGALMGLAERGSPRDGVTVLAAEEELGAGLESVRFLLQVWGPGLHVRLVLVRDAPVDVSKEFEAALRRPERSATMRLAGALGDGLPEPRGYLTASGFVAAVWR